MRTPNAFVADFVAKMQTPAIPFCSIDPLDADWRDQLDEAIELANDSAFGLGGIVFGSDVEQATEVARQIESGMVYVNGQAETAPDLPFGGVKRSGVGRELGPWGMREFANIKLVHTPKA